MRRMCKQFISLLITIAMFATMLPAMVVGANMNFDDFPTGWSKTAMEAAVNNGLLQGYDNRIYPQDNLTRAEMAAVITRAFGATITADISAFADVSSDAWYHSSIARAVKMGAMNGVSATAMNPESFITREEVFTMLARVLVLSSENASALSKFVDGNSVSSWAKNSVIALAERGYVNGDDTGRMNPQSNITREEFAQLMHNAIRTYITNPGDYSNDLAGIVVIRVGGVNLKGLTVNGDLVLGDGVADGAVKLENVTVKGRFLARGGKVTFKKTVVKEGVIANNVNGKVHFNNYETEPIFKNMIGKDNATFLKRSGGGGGGGGDTTNYITVYVDGEQQSLISGSTIDNITKPDKLGYDFAYWKDGSGNQILAGTILTQDMRIFSHWNLIVYPINYVDSDGTIPFAFFKSEYNAPTSFTIENQDSTVLPTADNINKPGYTFNGWVDANGQAVTGVRVTEELDATTGITLKADTTIKTYTVKFVGPFKDGSSYKEYSYNANNYQSIKFDDVRALLEVPAGKYFAFWYEGNDEAKQISGLTSSHLFAESGTILTVNVKFTDYKSMNIKFFVGYSTAEENLIDEYTRTLILEKIGDNYYYTYQKSDFEGIDADKNNNFASVGYSKDKYSKLYPQNTKYMINPNFWYVDETGNFEDFYNIFNQISDGNAFVRFEGDPDAMSVDDLNVYLMYQQFRTNVVFDETPFGTIPTIAIASKYSRNSRFLDTAKSLGIGIGGWLNLFKASPMYDEVADGILDKISKTGIMDKDSNVMVLSADLPISRFIKKADAENIIKQYINDVMADPDNLDSFLAWVDLDELIKGIDKTEIIKNLSDAQIVDLMKNNKQTLVAFVKNDLTSASPKLLDAVVDYIATSGDFKTKLTGQIVDALKSDAESELKTLVVNEITGTAEVQKVVAGLLIDDMKKGSISDSVLEHVKKSDIFINLVIDDLKKTDSALMPSVVSHIQTQLKNDSTLRASIVTELVTVMSGDTAEGKKLRKQIMNIDSAMNTILGLASVKTTVVDKLVYNKTFREAMLDIDEFRKMFIEQASKNTTFVDYIIASEAFTDKIVSMLRNVDGNQGELYGPVNSILNEQKFIEMVTDKFRTDTQLKAMLGVGGSLRDKTLNAITLNSYIASEEDLLKYLFNQTGAGDYSEIISKAEVEAYFEQDPDYAALPTPELKQQVKNELYGEPAARQEILVKVNTEFNDYKATILDKYINNQSIPTNVEAAVNRVLVRYLKDYLNGVNNDEAIEKMLVGFVRDFISKNKSEIDSTLQGFKEKVDAQKTAYLNNAKNMNAEDAKALVNNFLIETENQTEMMGLISTNYSSITSELQKAISGIKEDSAIYIELDKMLKENISTVNATNPELLDKFIKDYSTNTEVVGIIKTYMTDIVTNNKTYAETLIKGAINSSAITNADIKAHMKTYANVPANETTLKSSLVDYIKTMKPAEVKTYLKDLATNNETSVRTVLNQIVGQMSDTTIKGYVKTYLKDANNSTQIDLYISDFVDNINTDFVKANRAVINDALINVNIDGLITVDFVKNYIKTMKPADKAAFADEIYKSVSQSGDFATLLDELFSKKEFTINKSNLMMVKLVAGEIDKITFDTVLEKLNNETVEKLIEKLGKELILKKFNQTKDEYVNGLNTKIEYVSDSTDENASATYTTALTITIDPINEILLPLYDRAQPKVEDKLMTMPVKYDENIYLKHLVEHDVIASLLNKDGEPTDKLTGYSLKSVTDLYNYMLELLIVADDAICWYGDDENITEDVFEATYEAAFGKAQVVKDELDEILATFDNSGELPSKLQSVLEKIQKLNDVFLKVRPKIEALVDKYFNDNIDDKVDPDDLAQNKKIQYVVDALFGQEEPIFTINSLYTIFYAYDNELQAKLKKALDSGKLQIAIEKFENTPVGKFFKSDRVDTILNLLEQIAENGIEQFKEDTSNDIMKVDVYKLTINGHEITIARDFVPEEIPED